jgi:drug/metabolite transporter (DMT)-like permease
MSDTQSRSHLWPGVPLALGSAALFGAAPPLSKLLLNSVQPLMLAGLLYLGAGVGLAIYRLFRPRSAKTQEASLGRQDLPWLALAIGVGGVMAPVLLMFGLTLNTASSSALLLNLEGLATMAIAWLVYHENVDRRLLIGAFAILAGAMLLSWEGAGIAFNSGALLVAGACLAWGIDNNVTRKISATDPVTIAMLKGLVAGMVNIGLALVSDASLPGLPAAGAAVLVGFFGIGISLVMFILALRHLGTARTGAYYSLAPFISAILAILVLGESPSLKFFMAACLMAVGFWLHLSERHEHEHLHEPLEHDHAHAHDAHHQHDHHEPVTEPHTHVHRHAPLRHKHPHYPDLHHRHRHG